MSFTKITDNDISTYGVQSAPNKLTGTAAQNKTVFDALIQQVVKVRFNALIDELIGAGAAAQLGVDTVTGITADTVQEALEQIVQSMQDITQGSVADGAITTAKLADGAVTSGKLGEGAVGATAIGTGAVGTGKIADTAVTTAKIALLAITTALLADGAVTTDKLAALGVTGAKIANATIDATKLAEGAVTAVKIAAGAVTAAKLGADVNYAAVGLASEQVRPIYVTDTAPVTGAPDGIYLVTE